MKRRDFLTTSGALLAGAPLLPHVSSAAGPAATPAASVPTAPSPPPLAPRFGDARDWWFQRRYGLFVHWGLYAIEGWHEQDQWRRRIPRAEYSKLAARWNPTQFNPDAWLDVAERNGMGYLCFTTKHHDGFCLFASRHTDFHCGNTPYAGDLLKKLAESCHRRKFPLCLYYSIADWHHPNYPNQGRHHELPPQPGDRPDLAQYTEYVRAQVRELMTNYGPIHGFWWDMNVDQRVDPSINALIRELQPAAVINDRGYDRGDFGTPERDYSKEGAVLLSFAQRTEACQSIGMESWGWRKDEDYYTDRHLQRSIARYLARDANYLLNVGPLPDGTLPEVAVRFLDRTGAWYRRVREALEGNRPASHLTSNRDVLLTRRDHTLYVLLTADPRGDAVKLKPLAHLPRRATLLNTGEPVRCSIDLVPTEHGDQGRYLRLTALPVNEHANTVLVAKLEFDHLPETLAPVGATGVSTA
ncbi:MAG: alpha-L-fucosidase [Opitutaceae bacterium]|nr:alpha-L-fucosidase [Opitutaceae bacterium]